MGFEEMSDKQLINRSRYISDRLETMKEQMQPLINEFNELSEELINIHSELESRNASKEI